MTNEEVYCCFGSGTDDCRLRTDEYDDAGSISTSDIAAKIKTGKTTRQQVINLLGNPDSDNIVNGQETLSYTLSNDVAKAGKMASMASSVMAYIPGFLPIPVMPPRHLQGPARWGTPNRLLSLLKMTEFPAIPWQAADIEKTTYYRCSVAACSGIVFSHGQ